MKSIQIIFRNKGVLVEKWIVGGGSKVVNKTREFAKTRAFDTDNLKLSCKEHEDVMNLEFTEEGIFCKSCEVKLKLVPEWVIK